MYLHQKKKYPFSRIKNLEYSTFGRRQKKHRDKPVKHGQVASLHHRAGTERGLMTAAAYPRLVRLVPILVRTTATAAAKTMILAEAAQGFTQVSSSG